MWVRALSWIGLLGEALLILFFLGILFSLLRARLTPFKKKLRVRRAKEQESRRRRALLELSVRTHLVPTFIKLGFESAPPRVRNEPEDRKYSGCFPAWGRLIRRREPIVDQVEIQFSSYGRAAFRINAAAVPKDGMMTSGGHKTSEECVELGICDLETHARPWLRPGLRALGLEPLGAWFSLWSWSFRSPTPSDYDQLALRAASVLPELEVALREGKLGPHMRRFEMKPLPPEVLEKINARIKKLKADGKWTSSV
jgi:hypothetical protein